MKKLLLAFLVLLITCPAIAQNFLWAKSFGSSTTENDCYMARDASGNLYVAGSFYGTIDFDPGPAVYNMTAMPSEGYILKFDPVGNFVWGKQLVNSSNAINDATAITVDNTGNIYIIGSFADTVDFDPGPGSYKVGSPFSYSQYILKLDLSGNLIWVRIIEPVAISPGTAASRSVTVDGAGNVYVAGDFTGGVDLDPGAAVRFFYTLHFSPYLLKLSAAGNYMWAKAFYSREGYATRVITDGNDDVYVAGYFSDTMNMTQATGTSILLNSTPTGFSYSAEDAFLAKFNNAGVFKWVKQIGGPNDDEINTLNCNKTGGLYFTGTFGDSVDFDPGVGVNKLLASQGASFIEQMDTAGNFIWVKQLDNYKINAVALDSMSNIYSTGRFGGTADFDPGSGVQNLFSAGNTDVFIQKLDSSASFIWARSVGGIQRDEGNNIVVDVIGTVYTAGIFTATADFDPSSGTSNLTSNGDVDIFIQKLGDPTGIGKTPEQHSNTSIYPNPVSDQLIIEGDVSGKTIEVNNLVGQTIYRDTIINTKEVVNTSSWPPGAYLLHLTGKNGERVTRKVVKE